MIEVTEYEIIIVGIPGPRPADPPSLPPSAHGQTQASAWIARKGSQLHLSASFAPSAHTYAFHTYYNNNIHSLFGPEEGGREGMYRISLSLLFLLLEPAGLVAARGASWWAQWLLAKGIKNKVARHIQLEEVN